MTLLLVCDLEATCCNNNEFPREESEIIEIGAVIMDFRGEILGEYQTFIRPEKHPILTDFCKELTTIRQEDVDSAQFYRDRMADFSKWIDKVTAGEHFIFCSWGDFDKNIISRQSKELKTYGHHIVRHHVNLKKKFGAENKLKRDPGVGKALRIKNMEFEGTQHRALDDAKNTARLALTLNWDGYK